jgi:hypothetical protein
MAARQGFGRIEQADNHVEPSRQRERDGDAKSPPPHERDDVRAARKPPSASDNERAATFIVVSPRPQVGKTFVARLLIDFLRLEREEPLVFDVNPRGDALQDYLPSLAKVTDLSDIRSQMAMFDRLIADDAAAKVIDLGHASFTRFFTIAEEIGFFRETLQRGNEPVILFAADAHPVAVDAYADLTRRLRGALVVPLFNEAIAKGKKLREDFPFARASALPVRITTLSPMLNEQMEQSRASFAELHDRLPIAIPIGLAFELRAWTRRTFLEFRELELRLLLERLRASLPGVEF